MTRNDLTKAYAKQIAAELKRAYHYFGEYNEIQIRRSIERKMEGLWDSLTTECPEQMQTEDGMIEGYPIIVGLGCEFGPDVIRDGKTYAYEKELTLELVVSKDHFCYVIESTDYYHWKDGKNRDENEHDTPQYKKVKLDDVDKKVIARTFI